MNAFRTFVISLVATAAATAPMTAQTLPPVDQLVRADFAFRVQAYVDVKAAVGRTILPLGSLSDPAEIRSRTAALATLILIARWNARQGDIFTPQVADLVRGAIRGGCQGDYAAVVALAEEELVLPLPPASVHGRWPWTAPVPTMLPGVLAALPRLPPGLQYRFMNRALVLLDIDANLVVDYVPDAIPAITGADDAH